jgi:hypothetical protein
MSASQTNPNITRSRLMLEIASQMVGFDALQSNPDYFQAKILLRAGHAGSKAVGLFGSSTAEGIFAVACREVDVAIINPAAVAAVARNGKGVFKTPMPLAGIAVIPSWDQMVFAVRADTGLQCFEDIPARRFPLQLSMRGMADHALHDMFDDVAAQAGFSRDDIIAWGGSIRKEGSLPHPDTKKFAALVNGEINAVFDEGSRGWVNEALDAGIRMLPLGETTVQKLEAMGYRRTIMPKHDFPKLPADVLTLDFSGWAVFCHAETDDKVVTDVCTALDGRKNRIPWDGSGPIPTATMCRETPETPQVIPLHPAAERYWRQLGYL